jgi:hypothetical protein
MMIGIQPRLAALRTFWKRPLLRAIFFQHGIAHAAHIEIATDSEAGVFSENFGGVGKVEKAGLC